MNNYRVIAKVNNEKFVRYKTSDLLKFASFLDKEFEGWRWFNVYDYKTRHQLRSFTNKNRPTKKTI